jgi:monothiol glutaredoxin
LREPCDTLGVARQIAQRNYRGRKIVARNILDENRIHPAIREKIIRSHADIVHEVRAAIAANDVVVVGMALNPFPGRARRLLDAAGIRYAYLRYGSYLSEWRRRNALKMWTGWPTFPMVFVKGVLVGGASDLARLIESGELKRMLAGEIASS